jgi:hypothetical protein
MWLHGVPSVCSWRARGAISTLPMCTRTQGYMHALICQVLQIAAVTVALRSHHVRIACGIRAKLAPYAGR